MELPPEMSLLPFSHQKKTPGSQGLQPAMSQHGSWGGWGHSASIHLARNGNECGCGATTLGTKSVFWLAFLGSMGFGGLRGWGGWGFGGCWMMFFFGGVVGGLKRCGCEVIVRMYGSCFSFMFVSSKGPVPTSKLANELRHVKQTAATEALCYCLFHDFTMFYPMSLMIHRHPI